MVRVLAVEGTPDELPLALVAMTVKEPTAFEASVNVIVAEVPFALMFTLEMVMRAGVKAGKKEKVEPVRFRPVT
jgi:hypothetical protein